MDLERTVMFKHAYKIILDQA